MANKIQFRRGVKANLPTLSVAEPAFTTDTNEFFIGNGSANVKLAKQSDLDSVNTSLSENTQNITQLMTKVSEISITGQNAFGILAGRKASFSKTIDGEVIIDCYLYRTDSGQATDGTVIFTLPVGYRPASSSVVICPCILNGTKLGQIYIQGVGSGQVEAHICDSSITSFSSVAFSTSFIVG